MDARNSCRAAIVAVGALAVHGLVAAQSPMGSVTLFGGVDGNLTRVSAQGKGHVWQLRDGGMYVTKIGFTGREDLGGGLSTHFHLEGQAGSDTGNGVATNGNNLFSGSSTGTGLTFNRKITVSLITPVGEVRMGRDYTATFIAPTYFDPFFSAGVSSAVNYQPYYKFIKGIGSTLAPGTNVRASNMVGYYTPRTWVPGLTGIVQAALDEGVGPKYRAAGFVYANGPLLASGGLSRSKGPLIDTAAYLTPATASRDNVLTVWTLGASYRLASGLSLMGFYHSQKFDNYGELGSSIGTERDRKVDDWMLGLSWSLGLHTIKFAVMDRNDKGRENADSSQVGLGWSYHLSKRTALYGNYVNIRNKNTANYNFISSGLLPVAAGKASAFQAGLSHNF